MRQPPPPTVGFFSLCSHKRKRLPPVKGAGAGAPEGLFCLENSPYKREGKPLPYGIFNLCRCSGRPSVGCLWQKTHICRGGFHILPPDVKLLFHYFIRFHTRFFFVSAGAKKKLSKRNAVKETRKRGLFEKSPLLNSPKNFSATVAARWVCAPKVTYQPFSPAARRPFAKGTPGASPYTGTTVSNRRCFSKGERSE